MSARKQLTYAECGWSLRGESGQSGLGGFAGPGPGPGSRSRSAFWSLLQLPTNSLAGKFNSRLHIQSGHNSAFLDFQVIASGRDVWTLNFICLANLHHDHHQWQRYWSFKRGHCTHSHRSISLVDWVTQSSRVRPIHCWPACASYFGASSDLKIARLCNCISCTSRIHLCVLIWCEYQDESSA